MNFSHAGLSQWWGGALRGVGKCKRWGLLPVQVRCGRKRQVGGAVTLLSRGGVEERGKEEELRGLSGLEKAGVSDCRGHTDTEKGSGVRSEKPELFSWFSTHVIQFSGPPWLNSCMYTEIQSRQPLTTYDAWRLLSSSGNMTETHLCVFPRTGHRIYYARPVLESHALLWVAIQTSLGWISRNNHILLLGNI